ncbi:MAG: enoyl-CoA hydratase [Acidimicrobiia bacterium]|nr:enoyl-CoA hydratase [Acidimicrobiia bacterium]
MADDLVLLDVDARGVATITLNRPEARNALSSALIAELARAYDEVLDTEAVACVILTGTDPAFCAGMDLREMGAGAGNLSLDFVGRLWETSTPVIGAVNGAAVTGGLELALACDFLIASDHARFADTHARVGVMPGGGMSYLLPQAVGLRLAKELSLTGRYMTAAEAHAAGLVNKVVSHHDLMPAAMGTAHEICASDRSVTKRLNKLYKQTATMAGAEAAAHERTNFVDYLTQSLDPAAIEAARDGVIEHGRAQT